MKIKKIASSLLAVGLVVGGGVGVSFAQQATWYTNCPSSGRVCLQSLMAPTMLKSTSQSDSDYGNDYFTIGLNLFNADKFRQAMNSYKITFYVGPGYVDKLNCYPAGGPTAGWQNVPTAGEFGPGAHLILTYCSA